MLNTTKKEISGKKNKEKRGILRKRKGKMIRFYYIYNKLR